MRVAVIGSWFSLECATFVPGPAMNIERGHCSTVSLPGDREALVLGGFGQGGVGKDDGGARPQHDGLHTGTCDGDCALRVCGSGATRAG